MVKRCALITLVILSLCGCFAEAVSDLKESGKNIKDDVTSVSSKVTSSVTSSVTNISE